MKTVLELKIPNQTTIEAIRESDNDTELERYTTLEEAFEELDKIAESSF